MSSVIEFLVLMLGGVVLARGRAWLPWTERPRGALIRRVPLPLLARLRMHGVPAALLLAEATAGWAFGLLPPVSIALVALTVVGFLLLPAAYTLTSEGIALGRHGFRRWTEFGGVARRAGGARLQAVGGRRGMTVWLGGSRDDDDFVLLLRRLVRGSYQGYSGSVVDGVLGQDVPDVTGHPGLKPARAGR